ncbi:response regulator [Caldicellulosiruptor morganii]|nr:response regulator [Caldicellulosiruptor morganii]
MYKEVFCKNDKGEESLMIVKKILVASENEYIRKVIINQFENSLNMTYKYIFYQAQDGQEALDIIGTNEVHLVIMDVDLPKINGFEVLRTVKQSSLKAFIPFIILTDNTHRTTRQKAYELGAVGIIQKPFAAKEVYLLTNSLLKTQDEYLHINEVLNLLEFLKNIITYKNYEIVPELLDKFLSGYFVSYQFCALKLKSEPEVFYNNGFDRSEIAEILNRLNDIGYLKKQYTVIEIPENGTLNLLIFKVISNDKRFVILKELLNIWSDIN